MFRDIALNAAAIVTPVDKDGWRVDVTWLNTQQTVWVVRNGKEHRILSHGAWVYPLIRRALAAFDAGDVAAARAWVGEATGQLQSLAVFGITGEEATALQSLLPPPSDDAALRRHLVAMDALTRADQSDTLIALAADLPLAGARGALRVAAVKAEAEPRVRAWDALIALPGTPAERLFDVFHAPFSRVQDGEAMEAVVAARTEGADPGLVRFIRIATAAASTDPAVLAQQVAALDPADPLAPREAALTAAMVDLPLEATAKHLDGMITFAMGSPTTAAWVIPVLLDHGRLDDAAALWRKAAEAADDDTANQFAEGRIAEALGLPTIALRAYDAVTDTVGRPAQAKARAAAIRAANPQPAP